MRWCSLAANLLRAFTAPVHVIADHLDPWDERNDEPDELCVSNLGQPWDLIVRAALHDHTADSAGWN